MSVPSQQQGHTPHPASLYRALVQDETNRNQHHGPVVQPPLVERAEQFSEQNKQALGVPHKTGNNAAMRALTPQEFAAYVAETGARPQLADRLCVHQHLPAKQQAIVTGPMATTKGFSTKKVDSNHFSTFIYLTFARQNQRQKKKS